MLNAAYCHVRSVVKACAFVCVPVGLPPQKRTRLTDRGVAFGYETGWAKGTSIRYKPVSPGKGQFGGISWPTVQGRLNQWAHWAHWARTQGPRISFFLRGPQLSVVK